MNFIETNYDDDILELLVPSEVIPNVMGFSDTILKRWDLKKELQESFLESLEKIFGNVTHDQQGSYFADTWPYDVEILFYIDDDKYKINIRVTDEYSDDEGYIHIMLSHIIFGNEIQHIDEDDDKCSENCIKSGHSKVP